MARVLISTPMWDECLAALSEHDLRAGEPGSDPDADAILCAPAQPVDAVAIERMPRLRAIAVAGAGSDAVDRAAADARRIALITAGEPLVETVADLVIGLMIGSSRLMHDGQVLVRERRWTGFSFDDEYGRGVHGATLGLVGFGAIARAVARRAQAFEMRVIHHTRNPTGVEGWHESLDELLAASDIVSLHVPLSDSTRGLVDSRRIRLLKEDAVLINTARGPVLDESALAEALRDGRLLAAGLDVYDGEPNIAPELLAAPRTFLLPHIGSATRATRKAMLTSAAEKLAAVLAELRG